MYPWLWSVVCLEKKVLALKHSSVFVFTTLLFSVAQSGKFWVWQHQEMLASSVLCASLTPCSRVLMCAVCSLSMYICVFVNPGFWKSSRGGKQDVKCITRWTLDTKGTNFEWVCVLNSQLTSVAFWPSPFMKTMSSALESPMESARWQQPLTVWWHRDWIQNTHTHRRYIWYLCGQQER